MLTLERVALSISRCVTISSNSPKLSSETDCVSELGVGQSEFDLITCIGVCRTSSNVRCPSDSLGEWTTFGALLEAAFESEIRIDGTLFLDENFREFMM